MILGPGCSPAAKPLPSANAYGRVTYRFARELLPARPGRELLYLRRWNHGPLAGPSRKESLGIPNIAHGHGHPHPGHRGQTAHPDLPFGSCRVVDPASRPKRLPTRTRVIDVFSYPQEYPLGSPAMFNLFPDAIVDPKSPVVPIVSEPLTALPNDFAAGDANGAALPLQEGLVAVDPARHIP